MRRQLFYWSAGLILFGGVVFSLVRFFGGEITPRGLPAYSLSPGFIGMISGGSGYVYGYDSLASEYANTDELIAAVQRYLDRQNNPDLVLARLREFRWAYLAEVVESSTGRNAFGMMVGKSSAQISPEAGPNLFWNTKFGSMIAEIGGGYGMLGRLLPEDPMSEMSLTKLEAERIAKNSLIELGTSLELSDETAVFYGFYEFYVLQDGVLIGELDVNGFSGQVWYQAWSEPQRSVTNLISN